jgi:hypothetical protein
MLILRDLYVKGLYSISNQFFSSFLLTNILFDFIAFLRQIKYQILKSKVDEKTQSPPLPPPDFLTTESTEFLFGFSLCSQCVSSFFDKIIPLCSLWSFIFEFSGFAALCKSQRSIYIKYFSNHTFIRKTLSNSLSTLSAHLFSLVCIFYQLSQFLNITI